MMLQISVVFYLNLLNRIFLFSYSLKSLLSIILATNEFIRVISFLRTQCSSMYLYNEIKKLIKNIANHFNFYEAQLLIDH